MEDTEEIDDNVQCSKKLKLEDALEDKSDLVNKLASSNQTVDSVCEDIEPPDNFFDDLLKEEFLDSLAVVDAWSPETEENQISESEKDKDKDWKEFSAKKSERDDRICRRRDSPRDKRASPRDIRKKDSERKSLDRSRSRKSPVKEVDRRDRYSYKERENNRDHNYRDRGSNRVTDKDRDKGSNREINKDRDRGSNKEISKERESSREINKDRDRVSNKEITKERERAGSREINKNRDRGSNREISRDKNRGSYRDSTKDRGDSRDRTRERDKEIYVDLDKDRDRNRYERRHHDRHEESSKYLRNRDSPRRDWSKKGKNSPLKDLSSDTLKSEQKVSGQHGEIDKELYKETCPLVDIGTKEHAKDKSEEENRKINLDTNFQNDVPHSQLRKTNMHVAKAEVSRKETHMNTNIDTCIKELDDVLPPGTEGSFDLPKQISKSIKEKYSDADQSSRVKGRMMSRDKEIYLQKEESTRAVQERMRENIYNPSGSKNRSGESNSMGKSECSGIMQKQDSELDKMISSSLNREPLKNNNANEDDGKSIELEGKENFQNRSQDQKHSETPIKDIELQTPTLSPISDKQASSFEISSRSSEERWGAESADGHNKFSFEQSPLMFKESQEKLVHLEKQKKLPLDHAPKTSSNTALSKNRMSFERTPERTKKSFERSPEMKRVPERRQMSFERSPERRRMPYDRSPGRRRMSFERSPERRKKSFELSPERRRNQFERSPERRKRSIERSPERRKKSFHRSPERRRKSVERSPERMKKTFERSPERRRKQFERSPERKKRSFERSPERRRKSFDRSPLGRYRSHSRSKDRSILYRRENRMHSSSPATSLSLSLSDDSLSPLRGKKRRMMKLRKRKRSPFLIELERKLAKSLQGNNSRSLVTPMQPEMFNAAVGHPSHNVYSAQPLPYSTVAEHVPPYGQSYPVQHHPLNPMESHPPPNHGGPMVFADPLPAMPMPQVNQIPGAMMMGVPDVTVQNSPNQMPLMQLPPNAVPPPEMPSNQVPPSMSQISYPTSQAFPTVMPSAQIHPSPLPPNVAPPTPVPPPIYNVPPPNASTPYMPLPKAPFAVNSPAQGGPEKSVGSDSVQVPPPPNISQILNEKRDSGSTLEKSSFKVDEMEKKQMSVHQPGLVSRCEEVLHNIAEYGERWLPLGHFLLRDMTADLPRFEFGNLVSPILRTQTMELNFTKPPKTMEAPYKETVLAKTYLESIPSSSTVESFSFESSASTDAVVDACPRCSNKTKIDVLTQTTPSVKSVGTQFGKPSSFNQFKSPAHGPPSFMHRLTREKKVRNQYIKDKLVIRESLFTSLLSEKISQESFLSEGKAVEPSSSIPPAILPPPRKGILKSSKPVSSEARSSAQDMGSLSTPAGEVSNNQLAQEDLSKNVLGARNFLSALGMLGQQYSFSESELVTKLLELQNSVGSAQLQNALSGILTAAAKQDLFAQLNNLNSASGSEPPRGDQPEDFQQPYCRDYNHGRSSRS
ncbi:hypothetical protein C0J52_08958 [Blattella germanica]|nr:hypothetical protein C0J52_08958 [Blattella germanica]